MATYKVLQDIEAEDKLIGPLTLRQFIYAGIAGLNGYLTFLVVSKGVPFMAIVFIPITIICLFFAWPWSRDQPTEIWALARIRFLIKPRVRIWNQSGVKELVTITAPKRIEHILTNGLSESEVKSRLRALSDTIDSRGWVVKNVNVNMYNQAMAPIAEESDRLISTQSLPQPVATIDVNASDDMLDVQNNPVAQQFDTMINASAKAHRQDIIDRMQKATAPAPVPTAAPLSVAPPPQPQQLKPRPANDYWFLNQPSQAQSSAPQDAVTFNTQVVAPGASTADLSVHAATPTADEEDFIKKLKNEPAFSPNMHGHLHVIQPLSAQAQQARQQAAAAPQTAALAQPQIQQQQMVGTIPQQSLVANMQAAQSPVAPQVTQPPDAAILDLARNDDLNVATIAREAQKRTEPPDEVVISLH